MKKLLATSVLLLALAGCAPAPSVVPVAAAPASVVDACTVRLPASGPVLLTDTYHVCSTQFTGVHVDAATGVLVVESAVPAGRIMACIAGSDETLAKRGVIAGASVGPGLNPINIDFSKNGTPVRADSVHVTGSSANVWLICVTESPGV